MFVVIRSTQVERYQIGYTAIFCPRCKRVQPFECEQAYQSKSLYFVEYDHSKIGELITCDFCGTCYATKEDLKIDIDAFWKPEDGLQALIDKTHPELGPAPTNTGHTDDQLLALLLAVKDASSVLKADVAPGIALGFLAGIALSIALIFAGILHDSPENNLGYSVAPPGILAVAGALWWARRSKLALIRQSLAYSIQKHNIDTSKLAQTSRAQASKLGAVSRAVETLAAQNRG